MTPPPSPSSSVLTPPLPDPDAQIKPARLVPTSSVACRVCHGYHTTRAHRRGFFQKFILHHLGYFPWKCIDCSHRFLIRDRGRTPG